MLTGRLYLSNELIGGVFDEANRSCRKKFKYKYLTGFEFLSMVCA